MEVALYLMGVAVVASAMSLVAMVVVLAYRWIDHLIDDHVAYSKHARNGGRNQ